MTIGEGAAGAARLEGQTAFAYSVGTLVGRAEGDFSFRDSAGNGGSCSVGSHQRAAELSARPRQPERARKILAIGRPATGGPLCIRRDVAPSTEVLIGDPDGQHVLVRPLARSHPGLFDDLDANWIACEIQVSAGGFRGAFGADLRSEEFRAFLDELTGLSRDLTGTARFSTTEGQIGVSLAGDGSGHVQVDGEAVDTAGSGNRLRFHFETDQTYLPAICQALEHLLTAFPVIGAPEV